MVLHSEFKGLLHNILKLTISIPSLPLNQGGLHTQTTVKNIHSQHCHESHSQMT